MLNDISNFIEQQKLIHSEEKVLLAISGGIDSVVLAHLFQKSSILFAMAHCNFKLRSKESDNDEVFVKNLAEEMQAPYFSTAFETEAYAKQQNISIQMAARNLRREWLEKTRVLHNYDKIATAHHLNDSIETVIFNLAKGTGIHGLAGISPKNRQYIRPLLFASREMIEAYAKENDLEWREDQSNSSVKYKRNLIRHHVIPELKRINPNLEQTFFYTSQRITSTRNILKKTIKDLEGNLYEKVGESGLVIDKARLLNTQEPQLVLLEIIEKYGFNYWQACDVISSLNSQSGKTFFADDFELVIDRTQLFLSKIQEMDFEEVLVKDGEESVDLNEKEFVFEKIEAKDVSFSTDNDVAFLDYDKLVFPLKIRQWQSGDTFVPLGMSSKKKVSDFMIDEKIPVNLKKRMLLIYSGDDLVWIVGKRIDDRYKITPKTKIALKITNIDQQ